MSAARPVSTRGIHHLGLTVPDIESAQRFFVEALDFEIVGAKPEYPALFVSDGTVLITLWQQDEDACADFDRRRQPGLHHVALRLDSTASLDAVHQRLSARDDVSVEFVPEALGEGGLQHMMCAAAGGLRFEFVAPVAAGAVS